MKISIFYFVEVHSMYYTYDPKNSIRIPAPFNRAITPIFMGDDDKITDCAFSVHMTEWDPGCTIDVHSHDTQTEAMYCISGTGVAMVDGVEYPFVPDSMIVAPPKVMHQITNTGTENLKVLCIFSSPNTAKGLRDRAMATVEEALKAAEK